MKGYLQAFLFFLALLIAGNAMAVNPLASIQHSGGRCAKGPCESKSVLYSNGDVKGDNATTSAPRELVDRFKLLVETTDFDTIRAKPFVGTCPTASDGQEAIYIFYAAGKAQEIPSCKYDVDVREEPFVSLIKIMEHSK
jgi:hypothetical protein